MMLRGVRFALFMVGWCGLVRLLRLGVRMPGFGFGCSSGGRLDGEGHASLHPKG